MEYKLWKFCYCIKRCAFLSSENILYILCNNQINHRNLADFTRRENVANEMLGHRGTLHKALSFRLMLNSTKKVS